jgi:AcrR family transcriptional regulator
MPGNAESPTTLRRRERAMGDILRAANDLVVERGPDALSLREVARRADYSPAALYRYFSNKDELIAALGMQGVSVFTSYLAAVPPDLPSMERLLAYGRAYARFAEERPDVFVMVFGRLHIPPGTWEHFAQVADPFGLIVAACRDGVETGVLRAGDPAAIAFGVWSLVHGSAALRVAHLRDVAGDYDAMTQAALEAHLRGLSSEGGAR